ncbi:cyclase/dehydrase-like protein [Gloeomargarita lithophora Alchichica-D10]|uniref:Cyclase/dehydrase-like protein n=1 Tax=Gloeomargarita lithophora Alchichica-D10 TaxID=1188229 RepID=A0A1J0ABF0_9CYAN|nr:SRPBCC family protein [Gloeomargarita lithophora]APB33255.1 cyclase/dehydrase-like protein [Gloeomargarita lithophora Alchichica-D10]
MSQELEALAELAELEQLEPAGEPTLEPGVSVERLNRWERRIQAEILIPHPVAPVWQVLTDYEALADFIPNLAVSRRLAHPEAKIRLEQVGTQPLLKINFRARVVVDIEEIYPQQIHFTCVAGDFSRFDGAWHLHPEATATRLSYAVHLRPRANLPVRWIEGRITRGIQVNLLAIRQRVGQLMVP